MTFQELQTEIFRLHPEGQYEKGLELIETYTHEGGEKSLFIDYSKVCFLSLLGRTAEAMFLLEKTASEGEWFSDELLTSDPDIEKLRLQDGFSTILARFTELRASEKERAEPYFAVQKSGGEHPRPILLALHGNGSNAGETLGYWRFAADDGWLVVSCGSRQPGVMSGAYVWDDYEEAKKTVLSCFEKVKPQWNGTLVLGGFSKGAKTALALALEDILPAEDVIAVGPARLDDLPEWFRSVGRKSINAYIIAGGKDPLEENLPQLIELLETGGSTIKTDLLPDLAHVYPDDFAERVQTYLKAWNKPAERFSQCVPPFLSALHARRKQLEE